MPKIPTYQAQTRPTATVNSRRLNPDDLGAGIGRAVQEVGHTLERRAIEEDRANANNTLSALRTELTQAFLDQTGRKDGNLATFTDDFDEYIVKRTDGMSEQFGTRDGRMLFDQQVNSLRQSFLQKSIQYQVEATRQNTIVKYEDTLNNARNTLVSDPTQFGEVLKQQREYIDSLPVDAKNKATLHEGATRGLAMSSVQGTILVDPGMAEEELKAGQWDQYLDADAKARFLAQIASKKSQNKAEARAAISNARGRMLEGLDLPAEEAARTTMLVESTADPELANEWGILRNIQAQNSQLRSLRPQDVQTYINSALAPRLNDTATQAEFEMFESANKLLGTMRSEIERDPMSWAARSGTVALTPLDADGGYAVRAETARQVSDMYGVPIQPFTADEASEITYRLDNAAPLEQLVELERMVEGLGSLSGPALAQLGNENGLYAHVGAMLSFGDQYKGVAMSTLEGAKMLRDDKTAKQALGGESGAGLQFRTLVTNAFQNAPKAQQAARAAANALYVRMAAQEGATEFDPSLYEQAVSMSLGGNGEPGTGIGEVNGTRFILPPGVNEDQFERAISRATPDLLAKVSEGGAPPKYADGRVATAEEIADEGRFHWLGHGRYAITMQDGGYLLGSGPNGYYVLNVGAEDIRRLNQMTADEMRALGVDPVQP